MAEEKRGVLCGETRLIDSFPELGVRATSALSATCAHVTKTGRRCVKDPVADETLCVLHGGSVEGAGIEVKRRMLALQLQSLDVAEDLMAFGDDKVRVALVVATWDRTGLGPKSTVAVEQTAEDLSTLSPEELRTRAEAAAARLRAFTQRMQDSIDDTDADSVKH